ncbi:hypothetical protein [Parafilimonas sp.]|uniref:hypothetical protein n=1 Tax=Parafilimonas sp. TaxID=1969739 RepID=UPI0039E23696
MDIHDKILWWFILNDEPLSSNEAKEKIGCKNDELIWHMGRMNRKWFAGLYCTPPGRVYSLHSEYKKKILIFLSEGRFTTLNKKYAKLNYTTQDGAKEEVILEIKELIERIAQDSETKVEDISLKVVDNKSRNVTIKLSAKTLLLTLMESIK